MQPTIRGNQPRYLALDVLKGLGIIYLIFIHQIAWLYITDDAGGLIYPESRPIFYFFRVAHVLGYQIPLLAGVTFFLAMESKLMSATAITKRALMLAGLGYAMNFLSWGLYDWTDVFDWDVLQFISLAMLISYPIIKKLPARLGCILLLMMGTAAVGFSNRFPFYNFYDSYLYKIFAGDVSGEHYWPLLPWFGLFAAGSCIGSLLVLNNRRVLQFMAGGGLFMVMHSVYVGKFFPIIDFNNIWGPTFFKPDPFFVTGIIGGGLVWIAVLQILFERFPLVRNLFKRSVLVYYGTGILGIYILTTVVGYHLTVIAKNYIHLDFKGSLVLLPILVLINLVLGYGIGKVSYKRRNFTYAT